MGLTVQDIGYERLRNAIILQACEDYERALKIKKRAYRKKAIQEIEEFFRSEWFYELTDIDPEKIMLEIKRKARVLKKKREINDKQGISQTVQNSHKRSAANPKRD